MGKNKKKSKSKENTSNNAQTVKDQSSESITLPLNTSEVSTDTNESINTTKSSEEATDWGDIAEKEFKDSNRGDKSHWTQQFTNSKYRNNQDNRNTRSNKAYGRQDEDDRPRQNPKENWRDANNTRDFKSSNSWGTDCNKNSRTDKPWSRRSEPHKEYKNNEGEGKREFKRYSMNEDESYKRTSYNRKGDRFMKDQDEEFNQYEDEFRKHRGDIEYVKTKEIVNDLFQMGEEYSLAHCVAEDMNMGSGIAVQFRYKFKRVDTLLNQQQRSGGLAILKDEERYIYYLVTKRFSSGKPTYWTLFSSLKRLREHVIQNKITKVAMPRIGCGLDRLEWDNVKFMVEFIFRNVEIDIIVCNLEPTEDSPQQKHKNCKVVHEKYPIQDIEGCVLLYFSSEDGFISEDMEKLDDKFHFLPEFRHAKKSLGNVIFFTKNPNYLLCGCIVRKNKADPFDFVALMKCLSSVQKENKKQGHYYYGFQALADKDGCLTYKIINILRNTLRGVDVYVCWPANLQSYMSARDRFVEENEEAKQGTWRSDKENNWSTDSTDWRNESQENWGDSNSENWTNDRDENSIPNEKLDEDNSDWFEINSKVVNDENRQNYLFGRFPPEDGRWYDTDWAYLESTMSDHSESSENRVWYETSSESIVNNLERYQYCSWKCKKESKQPSLSGHTVKTNDQKYQEFPGTELWETNDGPNSNQNLDTKQNEDVDPGKVNHEHETFLMDFESGTIECSIKEQSTPNLPKDYSRVCYATENLIIESGIPPGSDFSQSIGTLLQQQEKEGGLASLKQGDNFLYCLIIGQPLVETSGFTVFSAMQKLRDHIKKHKVKKLVIPTMEGPTETGFKWSNVKYMYEFLLGKLNIEIIQSTFQTDYNLAGLKTKNKNYLVYGKNPSHQMKRKSVVLYLASVDEHFTEEMTCLTKKFDFKDGFKKQKKQLGDVVFYKENEEYVLCGCIVKRKHTDHVDFEAFYKCGLQIQKRNRENEKLTNVGIQATKENSINFKLLTVLLHTLQDVTIIMGFPGNLRNIMPPAQAKQ